MGTGGSKTETPPSQQQQQQPKSPQPKQQKAQKPSQPVATKRRVAQNEKANSTDMAILEIKLQRDKLKKTTDKYYNLADKLKQAAKDAMLQDPEKNKANAIYLIKRSKQYEQQIEKTAAQLLNLETSINAIEDGVMQVQVMNALDQGAKQLEKINQELSRADDVMENVREAVATQKEIGDILAAPVGADDADLIAADEDEMEAELEKLMMTKDGKQKQNQKNLTEDANSIKVPTHDPSVNDVSVPTHQPQTTATKVSEKEEEEENNADDGRVAA